MGIVLPAHVVYTCRHQRLSFRPATTVSMVVDTSLASLGDNDAADAAPAEQTIPHTQPSSAAQLNAEEAATARNAAVDGLSPSAAKEHGSITAVLEKLEANAVRIHEAQQVLSGLLTQRQALQQAQALLEQDRLLSALQQDLGFSKGRPVAPLLVMRCCSRWGVLVDPAGVPVVTALAGVMRQQLIGAEDRASDASVDVHMLQLHTAYWLATAAVLLCLLDRAMPASALAALDGPQGEESAMLKRVGDLQRRLAGNLSLLGQRIGAGLRRSSEPTAEAQQQQSQQQAQGVQQLQSVASSEGGGYTKRATSPAPTATTTVTAPPTSASSTATAPAALSSLRTHTDALLQEAFTMLRDQLKRRLAPLLANCMLSPEQAARYSAGGGGAAMDSFDSAGSGGLDSAGSGGMDADGNTDPATRRLNSYRTWCEMAGVLHGALQTLRDACVPKALIRAFFQQVMAFIDCQLMNQLLLRPECCSAPNARYVLLGLKKLDSWLVEVGQEELGDAWGQLQHVREAVGFLALPNKSALSASDIAHDLCPSLSVQQLYRLCTTFWDDAPGEGKAVSGEALETLKALDGSLAHAGNGGLIVTCLLDESARLGHLPFAPGGVSLPAAVATFDDGRGLEEGLACVPAALLDEGCPASVWGFLLADAVVAAATEDDWVNVA